ncbi:DEAD/DEAH box helicase [Streptomyces sp. NPDC088554]|uniref:DEAD/DEAH box helicase n=2 Tax=unclassified Streptomyces TaxID=2593676 RepID=UPI003800F8BE
MTAQQYGRDATTDRTAAHPGRGDTGVLTAERRTLAGLEGHAWSEHLKSACVHGRLSRALGDETVRRTRAGLMSLRDLRMALLVAGDHGVWSPVRDAVMRELSRGAESVRGVLLLHCQLEMWPSPAFTDIAATDAHDGAEDTCEARVGVGLPGYGITGPARRGTDRQSARDRAMTSLLARMAGVPDPLDGSAGRPAVPGPRAPGRPGLGVEAFEFLLDERITADAPGPTLLRELLTRAEHGQFQHRHMYALLFTTRGGGWQRARVAMLDVVAQRSGYAGSVLAMYAKELDRPGPSLEETVHQGPEPVHEISAWFDPGDGPVRGAPRRARGRKSAEHRAVVSLLAALAGLPEPEVRLPDTPDPVKKPQVTAKQLPIALRPKGERTNALMHLNQLKLDRIITKPEWEFEPTGTPKAPAFLCVGHCHLRGGAVRSTGRGRSKADARMAAGAALLELVRARMDPADTPAAEDPSPAPAPGVRAAAAGALRDGCALTLTTDPAGGRVELLLYRPDGGAMPAAALPPPMARSVRELALAGDGGGTGVRRASVTGWSLPLPAALGTLLALTRQRTAPHPSATAWAAAARLGLRMVSARLVHPALGDDGRGTWRPGPFTGRDREIRDHLAGAMPPHAHCQLLPAGRDATPGSGPGSVSYSGTDEPRIPTVEHALDAFLNALTEDLLHTPGAPALFGGHPFTAPGHTPHPGLRQWADALEDHLDPGPPPRLVLNVEPPTDADATAGRLRVTLLMSPDHGETEPVPARDLWSGGHPGADTPATCRRARRLLRRAAVVWAPAERLAARPYPVETPLTVTEAVQLHTAGRDGLAGVEVRWPPGMTDALTTGTVVGARSAPAGARLGLAQLLDFRWQLALNGQVLTDAEMDALAEAARPLVRLRGTWVLVDPATARRAAHRDLDPLNGIEALGAALSGSVSVRGTTYVCTPAGAFAELVTTLRTDTADDGLLPVPDGLSARLRSYQHRGLTWLARLLALGYGGCLADDMGLGKTLTAISLILHRRETGATRPTLVIARASLVTNWTREIGRFAPGTPVLAFHGPGRDLAALTPTTIVVTTYGILQRDADVLAATAWDLVVADEAQSVKNPATAAARRLRELTCDARLAMTGTPVENRLDELWAIMDWVNPGLLGTRSAFRDRYGRAAERDTGGAAARQLGRLVSPFLLRRLKSDPGIAPELPDKVHSQRIVQLTREQAALYEAAVRETLHTIQHTTGIARHGLVVRLLTTLRQICNHPAHYLKQSAPELPAEAPKFAARSAKLTALDELLDQIAACGESVLVFTSYVEMGHLLRAHLTARGPAPDFLHGQTPIGARQTMVDDFQAGRTRVLILSVKAAGVGLNLTAAGHVIHYDQQWNPAVEDQATDRAHRIGQRRTVTVHRLISEATLEDRIAALLAHKRALTEAVLTSGENALADLDDEELRRLVTLGSST